MNVEDIVTVLNQVPSIITFLLDFESYSYRIDNWPALILYEYQPLTEYSLRCSEVMEALYDIIPHSKEIEFDEDDEFVYPSMIYDWYSTEYVLLCISEDKILINQLGGELLIVDSIEAREYIRNKKDCSKKLLSSTITCIDSKYDILAKVKENYIKLIKIIIHDYSDAEELLHDIFDIHDNKNHDDIVIYLLNKVKEKYDQMMIELTSWINNR